MSTKFETTVSYRKYPDGKYYWGVDQNGYFYPFDKFSKERVEEILVLEEGQDLSTVYDGVKISELPTEKLDRAFDVYPEDTMSKSEHYYTFSSMLSEIDFVRIVREAPKNTPFILVESRTRQNQAKGWMLFINNSVLTDDRVIGRRAGCEVLASNWGVDNILQSDGKHHRLFSYRASWGSGKCPGIIKQQIEGIKRTINPRNIKTKVSYL